MILCVSAPVSFTVGVVLLLLGGVALKKSRQNVPSYFPLAVFPLAFGIQQILEGIVWLEIGDAGSEFLYPVAYGFLFFSHFFWPAWATYTAYRLESRGRRKKVLKIFAMFGLLFGILHYFPILINGGLEITVREGALRYRPDLIFGTWATNYLVGPLYVAIVLPPFFITSKRSVNMFGFLLTVSLVISYAFYHYAFTSVWCFFAAVISFYVIYMLHRKEADKKIPGYDLTGADDL